MDLKGALLGSRNHKIKRITVSIHDPETGHHEEREIGVRQVTLFERAQISKASNRSQTPEEQAKANALVVQLAAVDPDTGERLFTPADMAGLIAQPSGGWVDRVAMAPLEIMSLPVIDSFCTEIALDLDGKPVLVNGKPDKCGGKLVPGERYCPRCGRETAPVLEQVKGS